MYVCARRLLILGAAATLVLACSSKKTQQQQKVALSFGVTGTSLEPPTGHKQKLCVSVKGVKGAEFGLYTVPEGDEEPIPFQVVGKPDGTTATTMPAVGKTRVCYDVSEQGAGQRVHRIGAVLKSAAGEGKKDIEVKYTRPPFVKFRDVRMWFIGFEDRTWSMGYEKVGRMNMTIPPGTSITVDGVTTANDKTDIIIPLPLAKKARDLALADILGESDKEVKLSIKIKLPDSTVHVGALELTVGKHFKDWLDVTMAGVVKGPVTLGEEPAAPAARSIYYKGRVIGPARKVHEITHVLVRQEKERKRTCRDVGVEVISRDWTFLLYDRRKGKRVQAKTFKGKLPACPQKGGPTGETDARPDEAAVNKWMEGLGG